MEWFELDLTPSEARRLTVVAERQGVTPELLLSKMARQHIALNEGLGATIAFGPSSVDIRQEAI